MIADFQTRKGPMRAGPRGDPDHARRTASCCSSRKASRPTNADRPVYCDRAASLAIFPAFLAFAVIPFGMPVTLFGRTVPLQLADLDIGILWVLAMTSIGVYAVVLAGWSSGSNYPLLGSIRSTRADGLATRWRWAWRSSRSCSYSGHLRMTDDRRPAGHDLERDPAVPGVRRLPDLRARRDEPPAVRPGGGRVRAGRRVPHGVLGIKFALFYLGEYVNTVTVAAHRGDVVPGRLARTAPGLPARGCGRSCGSCSRSPR